MHETAANKGSRQTARPLCRAAIGVKVEQEAECSNIAEHHLVERPSFPSRGRKLIQHLKIAA